MITRELALRLMEWHSGQWSPLYSLGSTVIAGKEPTPGQITEAINDLRLTRKENREALAGTPWFRERDDEIAGLILELRQVQRETRS